MKKHLFTLLVSLCSTFLFGQSVPNGGFENWNTVTYENPDSYQTSNMHGDKGSLGTVNALKTTDAYHGNYAIKLTTDLSGLDTNFAYFCNGDPGKNPPQGGMPYNQTPTGIRLYYKSNIMVGDSALILVVFKKNGVLLQDYYFSVNSTKTSYTLFQKNFAPALSMTPDTVMIGVASSFPFGGNHGIPGNMIQVDSISFTGVAFQPTSFNGDMESWQTLSNSQILGWKINGNNQGNLYQTTDAYSGTYALELQTQIPSFGGGGTQASYAISGQWTNSGPPKGGQPYSNMIDTLVFYYKYLPADPTDSAAVTLTFSKNSNFVYGTQKRLKVSGGYTIIQMPISIPGVITPDSMLIGLASSSYSTYPIPNSFIGSDLKIDNMYLKSQKMPIANFNLPASGCIGQPVQLTDNSANMVSGWNWIMPGGSPSSSIQQNPQVTYATAGTKTITLYATNFIGSTNTSSAYSKTITIYSIPSVNASTSTICGGSTATLVASGATSYLWSSGQTTSSIAVTPTTSANYTVMGTTNGCSNTAISSVIIPATIIPEICMVSLDSVFANNIVFWDKTVNSKIDSFIIYREVSTNNYRRIGAQHYSKLSRFIDTVRSVGPANGDPNITSYRYKLQLRDSCGNYSAKSPYHNNFYFTTVSNGSFIWNAYEVQGQPATPVSTCDLLRDNFGTNTWTVVGSCAGTQNNLNDPSFALFPNAVWRIDGLGFNCNPTYKTTQINKSKSNVKNNFNVGGLPTGVKNNELNFTVILAPNPATTELIISFSQEVKEITSVLVMDVLGKVISSYEINEGLVSTIPVNELSNGVYFIKIQQGKNTTVKKFVKG
ncbi:MAG: T9SS type A sorting domain-containing protein [Bacteroidota bacterium]